MTATFANLPKSQGRGRTWRPTLTQRQRYILRLIRDAIVTSGRPPTRREIMDATGIRSPNGVTIHLAALVKLGYIERDEYAANGLRLAGARVVIEYADDDAGRRLAAALEDKS